MGGCVDPEHIYMQEHARAGREREGGPPAVCRLPGRSHTKPCASGALLQDTIKLWTPSAEEPQVCWVVGAGWGGVAGVSAVPGLVPKCCC